jgi:hypothetical protein
MHNQQFQAEESQEPIGVSGVQIFPGLTMTLVPMEFTHCDMEDWRKEPEDEFQRLREPLNAI